MPSDFDSARWNMEHTDLMNELVEELEERGCEIFIERQNSFRVESARSGVVVGGTPDIIAVHPDRTVAIYDAKTGRESASHIVQVQLYMYLLPKAQIERWRGVKFEGVVVYADGSERRISADSVDDAFVARLTEFTGSVDPSLSQAAMLEGAIRQPAVLAGTRPAREIGRAPTLALSRRSRRPFVVRFRRSVAYYPSASVFPCTLKLFVMLVIRNIKP